ncbi:DgyrCDS7064 [Dimorphilus gyrociliatus]|uniref:DgyrCDS7064 n=1 Tax=Dimorphilus gyrociliatus TaxID=2664684 RepID=A0A7I8VQ43_9ANNE|nr:DgyrCDS7064 [Dimorphilus gyrociliatus]
MKLLLNLVVFVVLLKNLNCQNTCFHCEWQKDIPNDDPRCGWGSDFNVPEEPSDNSVQENCQKCGIAFTKKDGEVQEVIRMCINELESWEHPQNNCVREPLYGGERLFCFCEGGYCNKNDDNIDLECPPNLALTGPEEDASKANEISCYNCNWKEGETGPNYDPNCGWGSDFKLNASHVSPGCGSCGIHRVFNDSRVVAVSRICYGPLIGKNYWQNHVPSCTEQKIAGGDNKFCYCNTENCNDEQSDSLPNACTNPTIPPTDPPLPTYDCYRCDWHMEIPSDERCRYGDDFTVPNKTGDSGVAGGCLKCGLSLTYRDEEVFEVVRICLGKAELGDEKWAYPNNTCSAEPLQGGKREFCVCEGNFCNEKKETLPNVCDDHPTQSPPLAIKNEPKALAKCFSCNWKIGDIGDVRCKLGNDFAVPDNEATTDCGTCYLGIVKKGDQVVEVQRACLGLAGSYNKWQNHATACAKQPLFGGEEEHCYCNTDICNKNNTDIQSACDPIPIQPPVTYNCFSCSWSSVPGGLNDDRCGWGPGFNVPQSPNDPSVFKDCLKCGLSVTFKGGEAYDITRFCATDLGDNWEYPHNKCSYDVLKGGKDEYCFCEGNYCNENNINIPSVCATPFVAPDFPLISTSKSQENLISCFECFWKRGNNQSPYDGRCGNDFTVPDGEAKTECGVCHLSTTYRGSTIEEIHRTCIRDIDGESEWREHLPGCSIQLIDGGRHEFCYCDSNLCNKEKGNIPDMCDVEVPTVPPPPTYSCFQCVWNDNPDSLIDPRCGYGSGFTITNNTADGAVLNNCFQCVLMVTFRGSQAVDIVRGCVQELESDWERHENNCGFDPLKGGKHQYCFCEGDFCNHHDAYIPNVCDTPFSPPEAPLVLRSTTKAAVKCYECFWKRGEVNAPFEPRCGYGPEFNMTESEAKDNCGMCHVAVVLRNNFPEVIQRTCLSDLSEKNKWQEHIPSCSEQPLRGAVNKFCYCDTDFCNVLPTNLPDACNVTIPTIPPKMTYNCFACSWSNSPDGLHDSRCGWGGDFSVPESINDASVEKDCLKCGFQITYRGQDAVDITRYCITEFAEDWLVYENTCSHDPLKGGKHEFCFCEGSYCNRNDQNISSVCDSQTSYDPVPLLVESEVNIKCYECFWKRGQTNAPYDPNCGYGSDFNMDISSAKDNCGVCRLEMTKRSTIEEIRRTCIRDIVGLNEWRENVASCSVQPTNGGAYENCHCTQDHCNEKKDGIPDACDVQPPTQPPPVTYSCFQCSWSSDGNGLHNPDCGWGENFKIPALDSHPAVEKNCIKCGLLITFKGDEPDSINRACLTDSSEDWSNLDTQCSYDLLSGGRNEYCFCDSSFCNINNTNIRQYCDSPREFPQSIDFTNESPKAGVSCHQCFWKRGVSSPPYDPKCGYGVDFQSDPENIKYNCGLCQIAITYVGNAVETVSRTCVNDITGSNEWREPIEHCSEQPVISGKNSKSCFCESNLCNEKTDGIPHVCSLPKPTSPPVVSGKTCFHCSWSEDGITTTDSRCGYGSAFSVPKDVNDRSVVENCLQCTHFVTYHYDKPVSVDRFCVQGLDDWEMYDTKCVYDPLLGGRHEYCYCKDDFCNEKEEDIPNVCDAVHTPQQSPFVQEKASVNCFECFWKRGESNPPFDTRCGWGSGFTVPDSDAVSNCDTCHLNVIFKNGEPEQIYRTCVTDPRGNRAWQAHVPACSDMTYSQGNEKFCHCKDNLCNRDITNVPNACSIPEVPATQAPTTTKRTTQTTKATTKQTTVTVPTTTATTKHTTQTTKAITKQTTQTTKATTKQTTQTTEAATKQTTVTIPITTATTKHTTQTTKAITKQTTQTTKATTKQTTQTTKATTKQTTVTVPTTGGGATTSASFLFLSISMVLAYLV